MILLSAQAAPQSIVTKNAAAAATQNVSLTRAALVFEKGSQATYAALHQLDPAWLPLPLGPYPPAGDPLNFPRTGLIPLDPTRLSVYQKAEPAAVLAGRVACDKARTPKLGPLFWVGALCLGVWGIRRARH